MPTRRASKPDDWPDDPIGPEVTWADESGPILPYSHGAEQLALRYPNASYAEVNALLAVTCDPKLIKAAMDAVASGLTSMSEIAWAISKMATTDPRHFQRARQLMEWSRAYTP